MRQLDADFIVSPSHRLLLTRVGGVVLESDLAGLARGPARRATVASAPSGRSVRLLKRPAPGRLLAL